jgi:hypothetical protein
MIHQFIFAAPKPGLSASEFQDYWTKVHAVQFASKIPQIKRYLIDVRIPFSSDFGPVPLPHQGIAEIWLENEAEQLASLQTKEFLEGARADEPNWAAFWQTLVLDTTAYDLVSAPSPSDQWVKLTLLRKRQPGLGLAEYRARSLNGYASAIATLPRLRRHLQAHTRDGAYVFGEAPFDSIDQIWFDDPEDLAAALASESFRTRVSPEQFALSDPKYVFSLTAREHWVMGSV